MGYCNYLGWGFECIKETLQVKLTGNSFELGWIKDSSKILGVHKIRPFLRNAE